MVVYEDIHIEDYDTRRHWVKTMEREDLVVSLFPFLICWVIGTTALLSGVQVNKVRVTEVMLNQILCLRAKTMRANLILCRISQLYLSPKWSCRVCLKSDHCDTCQFLSDPGSFWTNQVGLPPRYKYPTPYTINWWLLRVSARLLSFESNPPPKPLRERNPCKDKAQTPRAKDC